MNAHSNITAETGREDELKDEVREERDRFDRLYADWLSNRAIMTRGELDDEGMDRTLERDRALSMLIATTKAPLPYHVTYKMEMFEHYLNEEMNESFTDRRLVILFAGLRADLTRFTIVDQEKYCELLRGGQA